MKDTFQRSIDYLRVSVTDRCNLRCVYCLPPERVALKPRDEVLTYDEIARAVRAAADLGVRRVRLTGGEPLLRAGLPDLVADLARTPGIAEVTLTTNGLLLARHAEALARAGLRRVNVSLDTLREKRFQQISRMGRGLDQVIEGIRAAERCGLTPIKLNTVVVRGYNDDEVADLAHLTFVENWYVRFIELMPVGQCAAWGESRFVPAAEVMTKLESQFGMLTGAVSPMGGGPARYYRLPGARATIAFISPVSDHFCDGCNRLRLTADGKLRPCLLSDVELDIQLALRAGATLGELRDLMWQAITAKPAGHLLTRQAIPSQRTMAQIGG